MKNIISTEEKYSHYLKSRSIPGYIYRRYFLYPRISGDLDGKLLDYGCGIGDFLDYYQDSVGVDINQYNIDYCKSRNLNAIYISTETLPFPDSTFQSVILDNVLEHIPDQDVPNVINEIIRVLHPEGTLLVGVPGIKGYHSDDDHKHFYSQQDLLDLFSGYRFRMKKIIHTPFYFPGMDKILRQFCIYVYFEKL